MTLGGGVAPTGTPIAMSSERLTAPRRATSADTSGWPSSVAREAARIFAAPRRRREGGAGSSTVAPPTT